LVCQLDKIVQSQSQNAKGFWNERGIRKGKRKSRWIGANAGEEVNHLLPAGQLLWAKTVAKGGGRKEGERHPSREEDGGEGKSRLNHHEVVGLTLGGASKPKREGGSAEQEKSKYRVYRARRFGNRESSPSEIPGFGGI